VPLVLLAFKALVGLGTILPGSALWGQQNGLRVLYLHLLLLGFVTLGLVVAAKEAASQKAAPQKAAPQKAGNGEAVPGQRWLVGTILILLVTLVPLTGLWPEALGGRWVLQLAAWVSLGPVIAAAGILVALIIRERSVGGG
jgi:hypothetical protein